MTFPLRNRLVAIPVLVFSLWLSTGCLAWRVTPLAAVSDTTPQRLRVTRQSGAIVELSDAFISRDSVYGIADGTAVAVPAADVLRVEKRKVSWSQTILKVGGVYLLLMGVVASMALAS